MQDNYPFFDMMHTLYDTRLNVTIFYKKYSIIVTNIIPLEDSITIFTNFIANFEFFVKKLLFMDT